MKQGLKQALKRVAPGGGDQELAERVARLEREVADLRRHNLRLAELADVVQELLVPMAQRDQERVDAAIAAFQDAL
ncbi:DUF6752 domain-containing protein [Nocardioides marinus]|jgi:hypothetical protein|uniref:DUF6752 domain-containing protein n=1 Tax=Nocardioides marinus TaxID=374514 RepID=A0A7Z0C3Q9_9ACTN|nr:DUF6752 domain-containing protein [Nocardioides marinus]MAO80622.1 hypothetical protein [Nocardioides sp.]MBU2073382.1 hypothetical protein [Actinomycetota bacterium]NYI09311.1 hypothetical protein [Nocardioides marinus]